MLLPQPLIKKKLILNFLEATVPDSGSQEALLRATSQDLGTCMEDTDGQGWHASSVCAESA